MKHFRIALLVIALSCFALFCFSGCSNPAAQASSDLEHSLQALISGNTDDAYLYEPTPSNTAEDSSDTSSNDAAQQITSACTYEITDLSVGDNNTSATAQVTITAPDMNTILSEEAQKSPADSDALVQAALSRLSSEFPTKEFPITVELYYSGEHWMLSPSGELSNALSGGLNQSYFSMGQTIVDELAAQE